ncbi:MAG: hypothetical protein HQL96_15465 [Magnetococcales bacterium]|nr:hypothetical protein [Magnetococcales bacterium]
MPWSGETGELNVPHKPGDKVIIILQPGEYAHPSDYWWQKDPAMEGKWDYFTPVARLYQPVRMEAPTVVYEAKPIRPRHNHFPEEAEQGTGKKPAAAGVKPSAGTRKETP